MAADTPVLTLPTGTVTFLFAQIEDPTRRLQGFEHDHAEAMAAHRRKLRAACSGHRGVEIGSGGDSFLGAFGRASDAVAAAVEAQCALRGAPVQVSLGLHAGEPMLTPDGYVGMSIHRAARIAAAAHGGQVLLSEAVVALLAEHRPPDVTLRDMGSVRLKDLANPEFVFQVVHPELRDDFPALRSLEMIPNNLPQQLTTFIGREREIVEIVTLLAKVRLLTLTGAGGSGKTRLGLQVAAHALEQSPDGTWFVELAALADPELVPNTVAAALGTKEEPGKSVIEQLVLQLRNRQVLLVLDNCEHLLDACAKLVNALLRQCPGLRIVASSREALGIEGEQTYRVPSLSLPDQAQPQTAQTVVRYESVQLFLERARLVRSDFQLTNENSPALASLCCQLDGIPLAIELAAARVRALSVDEIARRLNQRFQLLTGGSRIALPRHRTLRSLIDWSYGLLNDPEKALLQRVSVFAGGWTSEAAEAVCSGDGVDEWQIFDLLTSLSDKSLLVAEQKEGKTRCRLLETVRQYARDKLLERGSPEPLQRRHRDYFLAMAEDAEKKLTGASQTEWLNRLETEHENLRAALDFSQLDTGSRAALRLCGALQGFWWTHAHLTEGREWCRRSLGGAAAEKRTRERAKVLNAAGQLARHQGDYQSAWASHEESLSIERELGDRAGIGRSLHSLGNVAADKGDFAAARRLHEESLAIKREVGDRSGEARALNNLGAVTYEQGDLASARALYGEGLAISKELEDHGMVAQSQCLLGSVAFDQGDYAAAWELHVASLAVLHELGERRIIAFSLEGLAETVAALGESYRAVGIWGAAERLREAIGSPLPPIVRPHYDRYVALARAALNDDEAFDRAWREGRALTLDKAIELALQGPVPQATTDSASAMPRGQMPSGRIE